VDLSGVDLDAKPEVVRCPRCEKDISIYVFDSHMNSHSSEILPWLFLGRAVNANNPRELTIRTGITHILNVAHEVTQDHVEGEEWRQWNREHGRPSEYLKIHWTDTKDQDIIQEMSAPVEFIRRAHEADPQHRVLVHCVQGISRSASVVIFYLMRFEKWSLRQAYDKTKKCRPIIEPRPEFLDQLGRFECEAFGLEEPTLTSAEVYEGKTRLDID